MTIRHRTQYAAITAIAVRDYAGWCGLGPGCELLLAALRTSARLSCGPRPKVPGTRSWLRRALRSIRRRA